MVPATLRTPYAICYDGLISFPVTKKPVWASRMFNDKSVLITGGTGSFGQRFTKTLLERFRPRKIIIFSRDELKQSEMQSHYNRPPMRYFIGDVRDKQRLTQACNGVDFIIHAAALKQVPAAEYNPTECIRTNINGAENVIQAAIANKVRRVMALSTDKATNPVNLYGATKLCSDKLFVAANNIVGDRQPRFSVVRYGNVVGSRGSVVPLFQKCIERNQNTLPITDPEMTRFWITLQQGVDFVLKCFERMYGGETFVPKIPSVRITDLATAMQPDYVQETIGVRPGEKLHEQMVPEDEYLRTLEFDDHYMIGPAIKFSDIDVNYQVNALNESGVMVSKGFCYSSATNRHFLSVAQIRDMLLDDVP